MKLHIKSGETIRIETDGGAAVSVYIEDGIVQVTARAKSDTSSTVVVTPSVNVDREFWVPADAIHNDCVVIDGKTYRAEKSGGKS